MPRWPPRPTAWPSGTGSWPPERDTAGRAPVWPVLKLGAAAGASCRGSHVDKKVSTMPQLARRIGRARPSAIMQVARKAARLKAEGRDIINFSIGVPNFLPGKHVYAAAHEAIDGDSGQYGANRGADALLDALLGHMARIGLPGYPGETGVGGAG